MFAPGLGWGQSDSEPRDSVERWVYCQIVGTGKLFSNKVSVEIDYGQRRKFFSDQRIRDEEGSVKNFNGMVDAMNYMGAQGWEFVQAYAITVGNQNVYHFLLRADKDNPIFLPEVKKK